jgi:hypothetical protein
VRTTNEILGDGEGRAGKGRGGGGGGVKVTKEGESEGPEVLVGGGNFVGSLRSCATKDGVLLGLGSWGGGGVRDDERSESRKEWVRYWGA